MFLRLQLKYFDKNIQKVINNAKKLNDYIKNNISFLKPQFIQDGYEHVYHFYRVQCLPEALGLDNAGILREVLTEILKKEGLSTRLYQEHPIYLQKIFNQVHQNTYPWAYNEQYIDLYKQNYSNASNPNALDVINCSFALGGSGSAPHYLYSDKIINLYIKGLEKLKNNTDAIKQLYKEKKTYIAPYENDCVKLSDTKGVYKGEK